MGDGAVIWVVGVTFHTICGILFTRPHFFQISKLFPLINRIILSKMEKMSVYDAAIQEELEQLQEIVQRGADVNEGGDNGWTPLFIAADCDAMETVRYLVEQGADIEKAGKTVKLHSWLLLGTVA